MVVDIGPRTPGDGMDYMTEARDQKIADYFVAPKNKALYEYDFGDGWEHTVVLEKVLPAKPGVNYPICIDGKRACPPEDCGGFEFEYIVFSSNW